MKKLCWALALCAVPAWGQAPKVFDLNALEPELPEWSPLGIPVLYPGDFGRRTSPDYSLRDEAVHVLGPIVEQALAAGAVEQDGLAFLTSSPQAAGVLERGLKPLRTQLRDVPLLRVALIPLDAKQASALPLGPLSERAATQLLARTAHGRLAARPRGGWLNARSVSGRERILDYEANQNGVVPVRGPRLQRVNLGVAARLRVRRRADGAFAVEGVVECARGVVERRVRFDGQPLDVPQVDRLRVVGAWALQPGQPALVAVCNVENPSAYTSWGLCLQVVAGPPPSLADGPQASSFVWRHDAAPLLPASYEAVDVYDPFAREGDIEQQNEEENAANQRLAQLLDREDLPGEYQVAPDRVTLLATGTRAQQLRLAQLAAARLQRPRALRVRVGTGDRAQPAASGVLRLLALENRPLYVFVGRESRELVGSESLSGGTKDYTATVTVPDLRTEREGFELRLEARAEGELELEGALRAVRKREPLETRWGEFVQLERQRVTLAGVGAPSAEVPLQLGEGPWGAGNVWSQVEVDR